MSAFGKMVAFEGMSALVLYAFGKLAPEAKASLTARAKATIAEASPQLAEQIEQVEQLEAGALQQASL